MRFEPSGENAIKHLVRLEEGTGNEITYQHIMPSKNVIQ